MPRPEPPSNPVAELPFLVFAAIGDADRSVGAAEADAYFQLLQVHDWARCPALVRSLDDAARRYPDQWRRYSAGALVASPSAVMHAVTTVVAAWPPEQRGLLERDLLHIATTVRKAARRPKLPEPAEPGRPFAALEAALAAVTPAAAAAGTPTTSLVAQAGTGEAAGRPRWQTAVLPESAWWKSVRTRLRCIGLADETDDVRTFHFASELDRPFGYKPGQFLTIEVDIAGQRVRRTYTIASSPSRPHLVSLTIKRVPGGLVSNWLHDHLAIGHEADAILANGRFTMWDEPVEKVLLLSAGIGITPVMSMARWDFDLRVERDTVFFHCARKPSDIVFRRELELLQRPSFRLVVTCTQPADNDAWAGYRGRMDASMMASAVPDFMERAVFLCGPDAWMRSMREFFLSAGCSAAQLHQESFGPRTGPAIVAARSASAGSESRIVFARSKKEATCGADELILEVAERLGIEIASSCRVGACGTCKTLKTSGIVRHDHCPGLSESDEAAGYVLTCSSTAEGVVVLDA